MKNYSNAILLIILFLMLLSIAQQAYCQAEVEPWGNVTGIRKNGQLFAFESGIKVFNAEGTHIRSTGKEQQKPRFKRNGDEREITTNIDSLFIDEIVKDAGSGKMNVDLKFSSHSDTKTKGVYFCFVLHQADYPGASLKLLKASGPLSDFVSAIKNYDETVAEGIEIKTAERQLKITFDEPAAVMIKHDNSAGKNDLQIYIAVKLNELKKGEQIERKYEVKVAGKIDRTPVNLSVNTGVRGNVFAGIGGNFRLQNPKTDPQVIDYCLGHMRVAYGRVEMPWRFWQPSKNVDPIASADSGKLAGPVKKAMQMAHRLDSIGMPVILSAWFPPNWAVTGKVNYGPVNGIWGNPLDKDSMTSIYQSIADYIIYLKKNYGVEPTLFSFNESDLGINIRLTPKEHADFIKGCGAYFASKGLRTKMLLGDNSDATTYAFIYPALNDAAARAYIGAVSFHSWRGCDDATLKIWAAAAQKINVPLIVGEGSIDAAAYSYPDIFQESTYALQEISLYTRLMAICQPLSILQWQLTADYSPLIGGGIFGNNEPLHPGQRFWNLKQLSLTPAGLFAMPIQADKKDVFCAALGDNSRNAYCIHLVNNGTKRKAVLSGLPASVKQLSVYITNSHTNMKSMGVINVKNGKLVFKMPATSYITLISV